MLAFLSRPNRLPSPGTPPISHRAADSLVSGLIELKKLSHVAQLLDVVVSDDAEFERHIEAFSGVLAAPLDPMQPLPEEARRLVAEGFKLHEHLDEAMREADGADLFGRPPRFQHTLRQRASSVYDQQGPPPEVVGLIAAFQQGILAYGCLLHASARRSDAPAGLLICLAQLFRDGILARLRHLASLGYTVDEATVPADQRLDLEAIHAAHQAWEESLRQEAKAFSTRLASGSSA